MLAPIENLDKLIVIGDRVLIELRSQSERTNSGLYLPPGVQEKEKIQSGYVIKVGPGYPLPFPNDQQESWKPTQEVTRYLPLQVQPGDLALFLQDAGHEVVYQKRLYWIVPQNAILMIERDEGLFE